MLDRAKRRIRRVERMADIKHPAIIWIKGLLFLVLGLLASVLLVV